MRKPLIATAATLVLACSAPAFAQTSAPDPSASPPADSGAAATATPAKPMHHHAAKVAAEGGETFAHEPGTGESGPASMKASNIDPATTHSDIAPHLPQPPGGMNAGWRNYLRDAERAIDMRKTGMAQQSLEMAETRLLDRSTPADAAGQPSASPTIKRVSEARNALAAGNMAGARAAIAMALTSAPAGDEMGEGGGTR